MGTAITEDILVIDAPSTLQEWSDAARRRSQTVGMVPTMGALHAGHMALVARARSECDRVVVSIFVNPTQFGPGEDLDKYPRTFDSDLALLKAAAVDVLFFPSIATMYPSGATTHISAGSQLTQILLGALRPSHFDGVALIVVKLLNACRPHRAYFGSKDAQQCAVVRRVVADLDMGVDVVVCPTVRDADGLALSSRNAYLSPDERVAARAIPAALGKGMRLYAAGERDAHTLTAAVHARLSAAAGLGVEYVAIVAGSTFQAVSTAAAGCEMVIAARIGSTRLIDAARLGLDAPPLAAGTSDGRGAAPG